MDSELADLLIQISGYSAGAIKAFCMWPQVVKTRQVYVDMLEGTQEQINNILKFYAPEFGIQTIEQTQDEASLERNTSGDPQTKPNLPKMDEKRLSQLQRAHSSSLFRNPSFQSTQNNAIISGALDSSPSDNSVLLKRSNSRSFRQRLISYVIPQSTTITIPEPIPQVTTANQKANALSLKMLVLNQISSVLFVVYGALLWSIGQSGGIPVLLTNLLAIVVGFIVLYYRWRIISFVERYEEELQHAVSRISMGKMRTITEGSDLSGGMA